MRVISEEITLKPGVEVEGRQVTTATVRLLSDAEVIALNQIEDLEERNRRCFIEQIASFGGETDRETIEALSGLLVVTDEERLQAAMDELMLTHTIESALSEVETERKIKRSEGQRAGAGNVTGKVIEWREEIDTADGRDQMIVANWQQFAAAAWAGYLDAGRGALMIDLKTAPNAVTNPGVTVEGTYETEVLREHFDVLSAYDPEREIVLFIISGDGDVLRCRQLQPPNEDLLDPPDAYRAEKNIHRSDPHLN